MAIGPTEATKLIDPGRLTELSETRIATVNPAIIAIGVNVTPYKWAT